MAGKRDGYVRVIERCFCLALAAIIIGAAFSGVEGREDESAGYAYREEERGDEYGDDEAYMDERGNESSWREDGPDGSVRYAGKEYRINGELFRTARFQRSLLTAAQVEAERMLLREAPGTRVKYDPVYATPRHIFNYGAVLTPPSGEAPEGVCRGFFGRYAELFGLTGEDLDNLSLAYEYETTHNGMRHLFFSQEVRGIPVDGGVQAHVTERGELNSVTGRIIPDLSSAINETAPAIDAVEAVWNAAEYIGVVLVEDPQLISRENENPRRTVLDKGPFSNEVEAVLKYYPADGDTCRLAWNFRLARYGGGGEPFLYDFMIDAVSGEVLGCYSLMNELEPVRWLVFPDESPRPLEFAKGAIYAEALPALPPEPDGDPLSNTRREVIEHNGDYVLDSAGKPLLTGKNGEPIASPHGWLADGAMTTAGNNVRALTLNQVLPLNESVTEYSPQAAVKQAGGVREFMYPLNVTPYTVVGFYKDASVTDLFYWCNYMHDHLYHLGFDEAAGNFQVNNFGKGGKKGDRLTAYALYMKKYSTGKYGMMFNNAFFFTPPDGEAPAMKMGIYQEKKKATYINTDSVYDHTIVIHEYCHGLSKRLVGGPNTTKALGKERGGALGEGWSDWFGISVLSKPGDPLDGAYPRGCYADQDFKFGNRRYPYSTRMDVDPLSYRHLYIDPTKENPGVPFKARPGELWEAHRAGEIWCTVLWEARSLFIQKHGFEAGRKAIEQLVVDGMKLTPPNPTFVDARDAILEAEKINNKNANPDILWKAFAKRGLGYFADAGGPKWGDMVKESNLDPFSGEGTLLLEQKGDKIEILLADGDAVVKSVDVTVSGSSGDAESVSISRSVDEPFIPIFRGAIPLVFANSPPFPKGDGVLQAVNPDTVTVVYQHGQFQPKAVQASITVEHLEQLQSYSWKGDALRSVAMQDSDNDGKAEIVVLTTPGNTIFHFQVTGSGLVDTADELNLWINSPAWETVYSGDARWADYDNDGDLDLHVGSVASEKGYSVLFENSGGKGFYDVSAKAGLKQADISGGSWADYDNDGDLDLFVGEDQAPVLYGNNGDGTFSKKNGEAIGITFALSGVDSSDAYVKHSSWADFNNDGNIDLLITYDNENLVLLYKNKGDGTFGFFHSFKSDQAIYTSWADYDNDGDLDLLINTSYGNRLFRNNGDGTFGDVTAKAGMAGLEGQWCSVWVDYDNDGFIDLISGGAKFYFYKNNGDGTFTDMAEVFGMRDTVADFLAVGDVDSDQMPELLVGSSASGKDKITLYKFPPTENKYISIKPMVTVGGAERLAIGARVFMVLDPESDFGSSGTDPSFPEWDFSNPYEDFLPDYEDPVKPLEVIPLPDKDYKVLDGAFAKGPVLTRQIEGWGPNDMAAHFGVGGAKTVLVKIVLPGGSETLMSYYFPGDYVF